jgi:hypothetical protein
VSERKNNMNKTEYLNFLNVTFKVKRNPTYTGNHCLARVNSVMGNTYPLGTTEQEMIDQYHASQVNSTTTAGDIHRVVEIEKCFEDRSPKGRFHKDNY